MKVALHTPDTIYSVRHTPSWLLLAFAAGVVNGIAFLTCNSFVSHLSGTGTRIGLQWHQLWVAAQYSLVLFSFVAGATTSVVWIQGRACRGKRPRWASPLLAVALILAVTGLVVQWQTFGLEDGPPATTPPHYMLISVLAFAMGLQNASVASTTGLAIRTTHLTGPATDLGIHLGTAWFESGKDRWQSLKGAALRGAKVMAFIAGAGLAIPLFTQFGYIALMTPAALVTFAAALSFIPAWSPSDYPPEEHDSHAADHSPCDAKSSRVVSIPQAVPATV